MQDDELPPLVLVTEAEAQFRRGLQAERAERFLAEARALSAQLSERVDVDECERLGLAKLRRAIVAREKAASDQARYTATSRSRGPRCRTISLPRTRSREMSHAPRRAARSTPKAAQRSGDSGDSSDPPGPEPAALAALFQFVYLFGKWTS
jgi:hypothetical protein